MIFQQGVFGGASKQSYGKADSQNQTVALLSDLLDIGKESNRYVMFDIRVNHGQHLSHPYSMKMFKDKTVKVISDSGIDPRKVTAQ